MSDYRQRRIIATMLFSILAFLGIWVLLSQDQPTPPKNQPREIPSSPSESSTPPVPKVSASPYLNTKSHARYVGNTECIRCHDDAHKSYLETAHSQALGDVIADEEPPSVNFLHEKSGRNYSVARRKNKLWHRESVTLPNGQQLLLGDYPARFTVGSGHHSRSYLMDIDGFLVESPLTWYASKKAWALSPGYDRAIHASFTRATGKGCVNCHSGRVSEVDGSLHRLKFHEQKISCERCHGPGSLHVGFRDSEKSEAAKIPDLTIVNPKHLSRELNESVCAQCHLRGVATVFPRGRKMDDFRPGFLLTDFRIDYHPKLPNDSMKVTGHFEQMHRSRCYTQSETLTCTTCHNPHRSPKPAEKIVYYRKKCVSCHSDDGGCSLPEPKRLAQNPQNNCIACHMPKVSTDIPHFAFTHHRIGKQHTTTYETETAPRRKLIPFGDVSKLSEPDRNRCLGLAYSEYADLAGSANAELYRGLGAQLLESAYQAGLRDGDVLAALARFHWEQESERCVELAQNALKTGNCTPGAKANALIVLGEWHLRKGKLKQAREALEQLVKHRRHPEDWVLLGICKSRLNDPQGSLRAFQKAAAIRNDRPDIHQLLANAYAQTGNEKLARKHRKLAEQLATLARSRAKSKR